MSLLLPPATPRSATPPGLLTSRSSSRSSSRRSSGSCVSGASLSTAASSLCSVDRKLPEVACHSLRQFSQSRGRVPKERTSKPPTPSTLEELQQDVKGCNGRWKRQKAVQELEQRMKEKEEKELHDKLAQEERKRRNKERAERARLEQEQRDVEFEEMMRHERAERDKIARQAAEEERRRLRKEDEDRRRAHLSAAQICRMCEGSGKCSACSGSGCLHATYLASAVNAGATDDSRFYGRSEYGCTKCGGRRDGAEALGREATEKGTGRCFGCSGKGKVWPTKAQVNYLLKKEGFEVSFQ